MSDLPPPVPGTADETLPPPVEALREVYVPVVALLDSDVERIARRVVQLIEEGE